MGRFVLLVDFVFKFSHAAVSFVVRNAHGTCFARRVVKSTVLTISIVGTWLIENTNTIGKIRKTEKIVLGVHL